MPTTRYARSGDVNVAYQVTGQGPRDLVYVPGWVSNVEVMWDDPSLARFLRRLASFSRLITFDKRGTGLSDRVSNDRLPTLEERMDDLVAVMDAVGSKRAAILGVSEGGNLSALFAATYPERTVALIMIATFARRTRTDDYPWAPTEAEREAYIRQVTEKWGESFEVDRYAPSMRGDPVYAERLGTYFRRSASPGAAATLLRMNTAIDITGILPLIHVPTLIMHRTGDADARIEEGRWMAERIPGARFAEMPGTDHMPWIGDQDSILDEIQEFLTGERAAHDGSRILATILFTDIVESTARARAMGDARWRELLDEHDRVVGEGVRRWRGQVVKSTGDGALATFDGPGRAISCARELTGRMKELGLDIRAGLHTGEVEMRGADTSGVAVHLAARIAALAGPGEILVSRTVRDLVAGSRFAFEERGDHEFRGFTEPWSIYAVH